MFTELSTFILNLSSNFKNNKKSQKKRLRTTALIIKRSHNLSTAQGSAVSPLSVTPINSTFHLLSKAVFCQSPHSQSAHLFPSRILSVCDWCGFTIYITLLLLSRRSGIDNSRRFPRTYYVLLCTVDTVFYLSRRLVYRYRALWAALERSIAKEPHLPASSFGEQFFFDPDCDLQRRDGERGSFGADERLGELELDSDSVKWRKSKAEDVERQLCRGTAAHWRRCRASAPAVRDHHRRKVGGHGIAADHISWQQQLPPADGSWLPATYPVPDRSDIAARCRPGLPADHRSTEKLLGAGQISISEDLSE